MLEATVDAARTGTSATRHSTTRSRVAIIPIQAAFTVLSSRVIATGQTGTRLEIACFGSSATLTGFAVRIVPEAGLAFVTAPAKGVGPTLALARHGFTKVVLTAHVVTFTLATSTRTKAVRARRTAIANAVDDVRLALTLTTQGATL